jgi:hypothetical protein
VPALQLLTFSHPVCRDQFQGKRNLGRIVMSTHLLDAVSFGPASRYAREKQETLLATSTEELARLRFAIILAARWEALVSEDLDRRNELSAKLSDLRRQYSLKIDEIAMSFGVQNAMNAKEEVERTVTVPRGTKPPITPSNDSYLRS